MPRVKKKRKSAAIEARQVAYRGLVLDAAERVFAAKGFDGAKIKDVADAAELALGTVYALFPSKLDVFAAVHARRSEEIFARVGASLEGSQGPFDALCRMQRTAFDFYLQHPSYLRMHLFSGTAWAAPQLDADEERAAYERGMGLLVQLFEQASARGELVDERPETCARLCLAAMQVLLAEWAAESFATPSAAMSARFERHVARAFTRPAPVQTRSARRLA